MWYSQGTITATKNNAVVNGAGTAFLQGVRVGDGITIVGSTSLHEVISVASNTQLTIKPAYTGTTGAGKQYAVAPVLGYDKDLSDAFNQLRLQFGDKLSSLQPWAHAATASAALDSLGFSASGKGVAAGTQAQGRAALGLGTAAQATLTTSATDGTAGRVLRVGDGGWMGQGTSLSTPAGYPSSGVDATNQTKAFRSEVDDKGVTGYAAGIHFAAGATWGRLRVNFNGPAAWIQGGNVGVSTAWTAELYHTGNTTKNPDGTLKASSPVINLYTDKHDLHNEEQFGSTPLVTRKSKGVYEITGTLGLRSEGWYLDTPSDRNGNKYFNIEWTQNITPDAVDGVVDEYRDDIVVTVETFERVWNKDTGMFENGAPVDINDLQDRFVQMRFNEIKIDSAS